MNAGNSSQIEIVHVITGLEVGGAESMLCQLLENCDQVRFNHTVVSLTGEGALSGRVRQTGVDLVSLRLNSPATMFRDFFQLILVLRRKEPDLVQTWLVHATFLGSLAGLLAGVGNIAWAFHSGFEKGANVKLSLRLLTRLLGACSGWLPAEIISCAQSVKKRCVELGFQSDKFRILRNGTDTRTFTPQPDSCAAIRSEIGIPPNVPVVGIAGRFTPEKDYGLFFESALSLQQTMPEAHFLVCGSGTDKGNECAMKYVVQSEQPENFHLLGTRNDMPLVYSAMTIFALTSASEAFPLVLGEAMACGIPCAATQVGDCKEIIGDTGRITDSRKPNEIAKMWESMLRLPVDEYEQLSRMARERIAENFSIEKCVWEYERLYRDLAVTPPTAETFTKIQKVEN